METIDTIHIANDRELAEMHIEALDALHTAQAEYDAIGRELQRRGAKPSVGQPRTTTTGKCRTCGEPVFLAEGNPVGQFNGWRHTNEDRWDHRGDPAPCLCDGGSYRGAAIGTWPFIVNSACVIHGSIA